MEKSLVVVESPAKAKTIKKYLGSDFEVMASVGHIIDLPPKNMGVDLESGKFTPTYEAITGKSKVIAEIKKNAKKVDKVYLAPDPDREGEAIAFHLASVVKDACPNVARVRFHELTKKAILEAFSKADALNQNLFDAQQARRILDRIVGYQISPILWKKVQRGLSAGRVQSVAVRLVVDREKEIESFIKEEYWSIESRAKASIEPGFIVKLVKINNKKAVVSDEQQAQVIKKAIENQSAQISSVQKKERIRKPSPPFITSKLQQDAARAFRFSTKQTMMIAQGLYEGIDLGPLGTSGLITYMRTDSTKVSDDAIKEVRGYIGNTYGNDFLPKLANSYQNKKSAQEAHEAIRPTSLEFTPSKVKPFLKPEQFKLYSLIFDRFVASQMNPAIYDQTTIDVSKNIYILRVTGSILRFEGFLKAYKEQTDEDDKLAKEEDSEEHIRLPDVKEGDSIFLSDVKAEQHFTQPPPRFSEASLVKELEEKGIGRPSTYAAIMSTILEKGYTEKKQGRFEPTELGLIVTDLLQENFPDIMNIEFTASMEEKLDQIEEGKQDWINIMNAFYSPFSAAVAKATENMRNIKRMEEKTEHVCPTCAAFMVVKWGKNGSFLGCSAYPTCSFTQPFTRVEGKIIPSSAQNTTDVKCSSCGSEMLLKRGKFGEFLGCSRYPDCSNTMAIPTGVKCPKEKCAGDIISKRTKSSKPFYGCSNYPTCDFVTWQKPLNKACETCDSKYLLEKVTKDSIKYICPSCKAVTQAE
jgi:DNA topoisomerase-1